MLDTTFLLKENLNSSPNNHGKKESKKEANAETADLKREEKEERDTKTEVIAKRDLAETDNREKEEQREEQREEEREEEKEDAEETISDPANAKRFIKLRNKVNLFLAIILLCVPWDQIKIKNKLLLTR